MNNNQNGQNVSYEIWLAALASSACIGFTSLVPWLFNLTFFERREQQQKTEGKLNKLPSNNPKPILKKKVLIEYEDIKTKLKIQDICY